MQRIDPGDPRPQEAAIGKPLLARRLKIDVAQNEAGQDEEQFDAQIAFGDHGRLRRPGQIGPEGVDGDPQGRGEPQGGQGAKIGRRLNGGHGLTLHVRLCEP